MMERQADSPCCHFLNGPPSVDVPVDVSGFHHYCYPPLFQSCKPRQLAGCSIFAQLALRQWLSTTAGLSGVKLESASELCEREEITSLADLRRLHTKGNLPQVGFKFLTLDMITDALEKTDTPADTGVGGKTPSADEAEFSETQAVEQATEQHE